MFTLDPTLVVVLSVATVFLTGFLTQSNASSQLRRIVAAGILAVGIVATYLIESFPDQWSIVVMEGTQLWLISKAVYEVLNAVWVRSFGKELNDSLVSGFGFTDQEVPVTISAEELAQRIASDIKAQTGEPPKF